MIRLILRFLPEFKLEYILVSAIVDISICSCNEKRLNKWFALKLFSFNFNEIQIYDIYITTFCFYLEDPFRFKHYTVDYQC